MINEQDRINFRFYEEIQRILKDKDLSAQAKTKYLKDLQADLIKTLENQ